MYDLRNLGERSESDKFLWSLVLLILVCTDIVVFRLAMPWMEPASAALMGVELPDWYVWAQKLNVFYHYASTFLAGLIALRLGGVLNPHGSFFVGRWFDINLKTQSKKNEERFEVVLKSLICLITVIGFLSVGIRPSKVVSVCLEGLCVLAFICLWLHSWIHKNKPTRAVIGVSLWILPFIVHFGGFLYFLGWDQISGLWNGTIEKVTLFSKIAWSVALLLSPFCFAEKPWHNRKTKTLPFLMAVSVALLGWVFIDHGYTYFYETILRGFGIELSTSPSKILGQLYIVQFTVMAWLLTSCFLSPKHEQVNIGMGLSLVIVGGFSFSWPIQYLCGLSGFIVLTQKEHSAIVDKNVEVNLEKTV